MVKSPRAKPRIIPAYVIVTACWVVYALLTIFAPTRPNSHYTLNATAASLIKLSFIVPLYLIWLMAIRGALSFKRYAQLIRPSREAPAISLIANGLIWTVAYLVSSAVVGAILPYLSHSWLLDPLITIRDHLPPLLGLVAFCHIYAGSHHLRLIADFTTWTKETAWILAGFGLFCIIFVLTFATLPAVSDPAISRSSLNFISHNVLLFSLITPYLLSWFLGVLASINIIKYAQRVKGVIYRQALRRLVYGILSVISLAIVLQALGFATRFLSQLGLGPILLLLYALLIMYALGFAFVHSGAKKLTLIEVAE